MARKPWKLPRIVRIAGFAIFGVPSLGLALFSSDASADSGESSRHVAIGEVSIVSSAGRVNESDVRSAAIEALASVDLSRVPEERRAIVSVSLVRLDHVRTDEKRAELECVVSAVVRDARRGAILAVLESRAHTEEQGSSAERTVNERQTMASAVRGALAQLPRALR